MNDQLPKFEFDFGPSLEGFKNLFTNLVDDVTDPRFTQLLTDLANDAAAVAMLKATSADDLLVSKAERSLRARAETLSKIPGLIASGRQGEFTSMVLDLVNGFMGYGTTFLGGLIDKGLATLTKA